MRGLVTLALPAHTGMKQWRIACFSIHQLYSTEKAADGLYHQRQAVLRNSANPESGGWVLLELLFAWRNVAKRPYQRLCLPLLASVFCFVGFTLAGGFSSRISTMTGNEVLLTGTRCGVFLMDLANDTAANIATYYTGYLASQIDNAANYAQQCYQLNGTDNAKLLECATFPQTRLPINVITNASCPFHPEICKLKNENILLDTGYLDSHEHFGINAPANERIKLRTVAHCAPLVTDGYTAQINISNDRSYTTYFYGSPTQITGPRNYTYMYSNDREYEYNITGFSTAYPSYQLGVHDAMARNGSLIRSSEFFPIPELQREDADVMIAFLSAGGIRYLEPITDPWYNATIGMPANLHFDGEEGNGQPQDPGMSIAVDTFYRQASVASPLACALQLQVCNSNLPKATGCTPLQSFFDVSDELASASAVFPDEESVDRSQWILGLMLGTISTMSDVLKAMGGQSLSSRFSVSFQGVQGALPANQWQLDVQYWFATALASMQASVATLINGVSDPHTARYIAPPTTDAERAICRNQRIMSAEYTSFSVLGIGITFGLGGFIILLSYSLEPLMGCIWKRWATKQYQQLEWRANDTLQLQRLVYEGLGHGTCKAGGSEIAYWKIKDPAGTTAKLTLINYSSLQTNGARLVPSNVKRVVIVIHGLQRDASTYMAQMLAALSKVSSSDPNVNRASVQVVAPRFSNGDDKNISYPYYQYSATGSTYSGGKQSNTSAIVWKGSTWISGMPNQYPTKYVNTSVYDTIDQMLQYFDNKTMYPNVNQIIVAGHSAGAQTVNRYASVQKTLDLSTPVTFWIGNPNDWL
ncbi:hypothetical protein GQ53DRAFT_828197 [Thozetella sp. PMI_491]|nr:hypothetical protein GQ53DRAFT_828197 [Thozetella sp. PMI_491]